LELAEVVFVGKIFGEDFVPLRPFVEAAGRTLAERVEPVMAD
jgi:hypothetical protein